MQMTVSYSLQMGGTCRDAGKKVGQKGPTGAKGHVLP